MRKPALVLLTLSFALVAPVTSAHPPAADPHNGCVAYVQKPAPQPAPSTLVVGTLGYFAPLRTSLPCAETTPNGRDPFGNPVTQEWGSHAASCRGVVNAAVGGAYCGPFVPPGGVVTCSWSPVLNSVPTGLVIGFDLNRDGFQNLVPTNVEPWVYGPYTPFQPAWTVPNPYGGFAQAIAFPTQLSGATLAPGDLNLVACV
jgi:hypothetical protein